MALVEQEERVAAVARHETGGSCSKFVFASASAEAPGCIQESEIALTIWQRKLDPPLLAELGRIELAGIDDIAFVASLDELEPGLATAMDEAGYGDTPHLRGDIARLARGHSAIAGTDAVRVRLEVVETDACRKFHADYVTVRTISTYRGQGTQWVEASHVKDGDTTAPIEQLQTGWVGLFKGRNWLEDPLILHRSPPLGSSGEQRLVLVIDPAPAKVQETIRLGKARS